MKAVFRPIKEFKNYLISENGEVYSITSNRLLKPHVSRGYQGFHLINDSGDVVRKTAHRLVAQAFLIVDIERQYVNHKDGNKLNNNYSNLEWCTPKENVAHAISMGLTNKFGEKNHNVIISEGQVIVIKNMILLGKKNAEISRATHVSKKTISDIKVGKTWTFLTGFKKYDEYKKTKKNPNIQDAYFNAKYTRDTVVLIKKMIRDGYNRIYISKKLSVPVHLVSDIKTGKSWKNILI